jgi:hypothetical protein
MAFTDRKTPGGEDITKYLSAENFNNWKTMVTLHPTNIQNYAEVRDKIAKEFTELGIEEKHNRREKFIFLIVLHADNPKPFNNLLMDKDCVTMLKRMYDGEDGSTKERNKLHNKLPLLYFVQL